ncbi:MAG: hypothetical protein BRD49_00770, partial [Bacteroidetes bacterium SW_10_40_5]
SLTKKITQPLSGRHRASALSKPGKLSQRGLPEASAIQPFPFIQFSTNTATTNHEQNFGYCLSAYFSFPKFKSIRYQYTNLKL